MAIVYTRKCKTCEADFSIDEKLAKWFRDKGFELPTHCEKCRTARKASKQKKEINNYGKKE